MTQHNKLSLWNAVAINTNIIIGSGIFINTTELAKRAGVCSALVYALVGLLLFPLILAFSQLLRHYPTGGFYTFCSSSLHPFVGYISTWCYFVTKISSATLVMHVFAILLQKTFPVLAAYDTFCIDIAIVALLSGLNMLNIKTGSTIQNYLMLLKLMPLLFVIITGLFFINGENLSTIHQLWSGVPASIPLVLHAMLGFEAACAISRNIENPEKNAPRAVLLSYCLVMLLYVSFQGLLYAALGESLTKLHDYREVFPALMQRYNVSSTLNNFIVHAAHAAIGLSALSAGFGMMYANMWNLYSLAELKLFAGAKYFKFLNKFDVPFLCVLAESFLAITYLCIIKNEQTTYQQLSGFGATVTYFLSIMGLIALRIRQQKGITIGVLALINCIVLLTASVQTMWCVNNPKPLIMFAVLTSIGTILFMINKKSLNQKEKIL